MVSSCAPGQVVVVDTTVALRQVITPIRYLALAWGVMSESSVVSGSGPAGRLLNLVIALVNTGVSMSKAQVRWCVAGYGEASSVEAFERMFERDKDTLRELGVPIVTVENGVGGEVGYRIDGEAYGMARVDLTGAEFGVLALAAQLWQDRTVGADASRGLMKLQAAGVGEVENDVVAGLAPRVRPVGAAYAPLMGAIVERRVVRFTYRAASTGVVAERLVEPWRLVARGGGWYVVGFDRGREGPRAFRLSRMEGRVRAVGGPGAFEVPDAVDVDGLLGDAGESGVARLAVSADRAEALRARGQVVASTGPGTGGRDVVDVEFTSLSAFADEVVGYADAVVVLGPASLRTIVMDRLRRAAAWMGADRG